MLKEFLKEVEQASFFTVNCFNDRIVLRGRILSPQEAESVSLSSSLMISQISQAGGKRLQDLRNLSDRLMSDEVKQEEIDEAFQFIQKLKPSQIEAIAEQQSKVISQVVKEASMDNGATWEPIKITLEQDKQDAEKNILWIGMLSTIDRSNIINSTMQGHREAVERLSTFRR